MRRKNYRGYSDSSLFPTPPISHKEIINHGGVAVFRTIYDSECNAALSTDLYSVPIMMTNPQSAKTLDCMVLPPSESAVDSFASMVASDKTLDNDND